MPHRKQNLEAFDFNKLVAQIANSMLPDCNKPFAIYGHSMGGLLGISIANYLAKNHNKYAQHIFLGASFPLAVNQTLYSFLKQNTELTLESAKQFLSGYNKSCTEIDDLTGMEKVAQADLLLLQHGFMDASYVHESKTPITLVAAKNDTVAAPEILLNSWKQFLQKEIHYKVIDGSHLFIHEERARHELHLYVINTLLGGKDTVMYNDVQTLNTDQLTINTNPN